MQLYKYSFIFEIFNANYLKLQCLNVVLNIANEDSMKMEYFITIRRPYYLIVLFIFLTVILDHVQYVQFTYEIEINNALPFLEILVSCTEKHNSIPISRKHFEFALHLLAQSFLLLPQNASFLCFCKI